MNIGFRNFLTLNVLPLADEHKVFESYKPPSISSKELKSDCSK